MLKILHPCLAYEFNTFSKKYGLNLPSNNRSLSLITLYSLRILIKLDLLVSHLFELSVILLVTESAKMALSLFIID